MMKYLKAYKIFESMSDLASDSYNKRQERLRTLEDMSLELWDENFNVQVSSEVLSRDDKYIKVSIQKRGAERFDYNKIKDVLLNFEDAEFYEDCVIIKDILTEKINCIVTRND